MKGVLGVVALVSGMALACQVGFNSELRSRVGHPISAALASFGVGTLALTLYLAVLRPGWPGRERLASAPWWAWLGGLVGAVYVAASAAYSRRLGATVWMALVIAGQILAALVLDHYGLIGFQARAVTPERLVGVALLLIGVWLVLRA